jgi:hypothetical protein
MSLETYSGSNADVLELLFPEGKWREMIAKIAWEIYDELPTDNIRLKRWGFSIPIPRFIFDKFMVLLFGNKP